MKIIANGIIQNDVPDISGTKLDTMKALAPKLEHDLLEQTSKYDRTSFSQIGKQIAASNPIRQEYETNGEKIVEFKTTEKPEMKGEPATLRQELFAAVAKIHRRQERYLESQGYIPFEKQFAANVEFLSKAFAEMREKTPHLFKAYTGKIDVITKLATGTAWELGDFTLDDWLDMRSETWENSIAGLDDVTKNKIYARARERGMK